MNSPKNTIESGGFYLAGKQLCKVEGFETDPNGQTRVRYLVKSSTISGKKFGYQGTKSNRIFLENFVKKVDKKLTDQEIQTLKKNNVILDGE